MQLYQKALKADPTYKPAAECLAIVLTDLGTSLKLAGNTEEGIQKYHDALNIDGNYAVSCLCFKFDILLTCMHYLYSQRCRFPVILILA